MITEEQALVGVTCRVNGNYPDGRFKGLEVEIVRVFADPPPHAPAVLAWCVAHEDSYVIELDELDPIIDHA